MSMRNERYFAQGVRISNDTRVTGLNNHDLVIGGSGSSKTGSYVFNLLLNPNGSLVVSDTKGLLHRRFKSYLKSRGYDVRVIDFVNPSKSEGYNPLDYIRFDDKGRVCERDIKKLATCIVPALDKQEPFWEKSASRYISVLIGYVMEALPPKERDMKHVLAVHRQILRDYAENKNRKATESRCGLLEVWSHDNPDSYTTRKYAEMSVSQDAEKMWGSIYEFANEALDNFDYADYDSIFNSGRSFDFNQLGNRKTVLFLNGSDNDKTFHTLQTILQQQLLQTLCHQADSNLDGRLKVPVRIVLDDFASGAPIADFDMMISTLRSREISVSVIIQSVSQLESKYSKADSDTIINNCDHVLVLQTKDKATVNLISTHANKDSHTIMTIPRNKAIVLETGSDAIIADKLPAYQMREEIRNQLDPKMVKEIMLEL